MCSTSILLSLSSSINRLPQLLSRCTCVLCFSMCKYSLINFIG
uniref:Uncharacterized protein n=1 Tax=Siphoviridae sp. ctr2f5 TaxID=2825684 RepID=A0A8S5QDM4_9CAUD|nr:MAG TPA: hypothetical protein [Siphoviridae sp. ctr2f5]